LTRQDVAFTLDAPRLRAAKGAGMAKLALVYGLRLFPSEELGEIGEATLTLKDGRTARVTMHLIEGSKEEIEKTLQQSLEAFFDMYPEI
jgi:hypothetical protein